MVELSELILTSLQTTFNSCRNRKNTKKSRECTQRDFALRLLKKTLRSLRLFSVENKRSLFDFRGQDMDPRVQRPSLITESLSINSTSRNPPSWSRPGLRRLR